MEYSKEAIQYILNLHEEGVREDEIAKRTSNKFRGTITGKEAGLIIRASESRHQVVPTERKHWPVRVD